MSNPQGVFLCIEKHLPTWKQIHSSVERDHLIQTFCTLYTAKGLLIPAPLILGPKSQGWPLILGSNLQYSSSPSPIRPLGYDPQIRGGGPWDQAFPFILKSTGLDFFSVNGEHLKSRNIAFLETRRQLTPT